MAIKNKLPHSYTALFIVATFSILFINYGRWPEALFKYKKTGPVTSEAMEVPKSYHPDYVRGVYLTAYSAGNDSFRQNIIESMKESRINTVVIDIKDYSGYILYDSQIPIVQEIGATKNRMPNLEKIIEEFHAIDAYVIARQTVFQDPVLAAAKPELAFKTWNGNLWYDNNGLAWVDPKQKGVWEYNLAIAKEAVKLGFDEINFDYMRYPSDGNMANLNYNLEEGETKAGNMDKFFAWLSNNLSSITTISIDTFGLVLDHTDDNYDLNIGQRLDQIANHFDYVCPMMYPSHYPLQYLGYENSAEHPYAVISYGLDISSSTIKMKRAKLRPWLQAFHLRAHYYQDKIDAQAQAAEEAETTEGWLMWNARNYYPDYIF